ncbi:LOW QUALITY PROTEIN: BRCA1-associated RING domain protein 1 [Bufo gargarizans]|uniref:LOW QUALITY PROTEIN: BRCA1-associated RING domain protein 1 n=1 Tax=Bufo gargarizans TaxID=30331 RepID=UPI001CF285C0|nr:LOW QUALITY PROTEIN: BRCA1-associated RING domain protein 1 [Bufo gargarizans]
MPLRVRSGNRPADTAADSTMKKELPDWNRTRTALLEMEGRLRCSVCLSLLRGPVCLGGCEHVFCRTCVDGSVGNECPVCHTPAWVKDVQINRQLDTMIQLCSQLHNLLDKGKHNGSKVDLCQHASLKENTAEGESKKKQIKMWFSPRRGKVRYVLEREENNQQIPSNCEQAPMLSSYDFVSSSPIVEHAKKKTVKRGKTKKKQLEDINQKWGIGTPSENTDSFKVNNQESNRSVSFCSPPLIENSPEKMELGLENNSPEKMELGLENHGEINTIENNTSKENDILKSGESASGAGQENDYSFEPKPQENGQNKSQLEETVEDRPSPKLCTQLKNESSGKTKRRRTPLKRKPHPTPSPNSRASKCPKKEKLADDSKSEDHTGLGKVRNKEVKNSPKAEPKPKPFSTPRRKSQPGTNLQTSPSDYQFTKKNHKGETMLHVASIKGEVHTVEELLKSGANPNIKDNAGWTPLHEACNHGHTNVVEVLLRHHALVNTTGYQNDTPLHDAVKNGHVAIVRLLLQHGALQDAVNIFGLQPVDYAETEEIKSALLQTRTDKKLHSPGPAPKVAQCREGSLIILASGLSTSQRTDLNKLVSLFKAEICTNYSSSVTHIIVGEEPMLRTMKCMMGILSGCWILRCAWLKTCLETKRREPEELHEVAGGPHRARLNREQMLPSLLDGCHFYFLGCFKEHRKEDLIELVKAAGGQILIRQPKPDSDVTQTINTVAYHADAESDQRFCTQYIIYDKSSKFIPGRVRQGKVWFAPSSWLIECITSFHLLPVPQT